MSIFLFDTETTGTGDGAEIIEAALGELVAPESAPLRPELVRVTAERFKPEGPIELGALATHHIIATDLAACPPSSTFALPPDTKLLIGHNIEFDWKMAGAPLIHRVCTLALARSLWPTLDSHTLGALLYHLLPHDEARARLVGAHNAPQDVYNLSFLLARICDVLQPESWKHLYRLSEEARIPTIMAFGKHKGTLVVDLPADYRQWIMRRPDMDEYVKIAVRRSFGAAS